MFRSFIVATDLSPRGDRAVGRAFDLAARHGARLSLVHVTDDALPEPMAGTMRDEAQKCLSRFAATRPGAGDVRHETRAILGDPAEAIVREAGHTGADLVILGLHRARAFFDSVRETTMERIVRHCARPVLLVRDPADHAYAGILAAVDFTPASMTALNVAARLAPGAALHAVHAVHVPYHRFSGPAGQAEAAAPFLNEARNELARWRSGADLPEALGDVEIVEGPIGSTLLRRVGAGKADLLCLGAHGRAGISRAILGSVAMDLIRTPPCDLLIAR